MEPQLLWNEDRMSWTRCLPGIAGALLLFNAANAEEVPSAWMLVVAGELSSVSSNEIVIEADPTVIAFSDRPDRLVRTMEIETLVDKGWVAGSSNSFAHDPPNAAIVSSDERFEIAELSAARREGRKVSFTVAGFSGAPPTGGGRVALVIDGFCLPCTE